MGKVLDVYWHCAEPGDNYLGRVLVGLDALSSDFNVLPPHFCVEAPMENPSICRAMELMYGPILDTWADTPNNPTGLLLRVLASVIHHFDWIKSIVRSQTDHPFNAIPLLFEPELVSELKDLVTTDPSDVIREPDGIPSHVGQSIKLQNLLEIATSCLELLRNQAVDIKQVRQKIISRKF